MSVIRSSFIRPALLLLCIGFLGSSHAVANDQDLWTTTVPASACQPLNASSLSRVTMSNAAWVFSGNNTGSVTFYCPLPVNAFTVANFTNDNDISRFRVYYRDTDGMGLTSQVTARLVFRQAPGLFFASPVWDSNNHPAVANTTALQPAIHDVQADALYSFRVTLRRTSTTESPAFAGIDFPFPNEG